MGERAGAAQNVRAHKLSNEEAYTMKKTRVIILLSSILFVAGLGVAMAGCGDNRDDTPPMPGTPDDPDYADSTKDKGD